MTEGDRRRLLGGFAAAVLCAGLAATLAAPPRPRLVWNASSSTPVGLYRIEAARDIHRGHMVLAWPPARARRLAATRGYLPATVPLVKPVAAVAGDRVCARSAGISVNARPVARRRIADPHGRRLPWWSGCRVLGAGELFLLSTNVPDAFDGRYFAVTRGPDVIGRAVRIWPR